MFPFPTMVQDLFNWLVPHKGHISSRVPIGFTGQGCLWYTDTAPEGWLICDGSLVSIEDYKELYILIGDTWGTATATHFYLPDLRQRVPVGKHSSGTFSSLNNSGGVESYNMTTGMLVGHWHSIWLNTSHADGTVTGYESLSAPLQAGGRARYRGSTGQSTNGNSWGTGAQAEVSGSIRSTPTEPLSTLQPYRVVNYIIKV